jgi:hypothetical protein
MAAQERALAPETNVSPTAPITIGWMIKLEPLTANLTTLNSAMNWVAGEREEREVNGYPRTRPSVCSETRPQNRQKDKPPIESRRP